jgi:PAS domain S-box-containing protein
MKEEKQTKPQLLVELATLRQRVATLEIEVAERQQREVELRESQDRYRALSENATDIIATFTLDQIITNVNRGAEVLLGWSREELIGQHVDKVATPASIALAEDRARRSLARERLSPTFEVELIRKDGSLVPAEAWTRAIRDQQGKLSGFHGIYRDITERKQAEEQLRRYAERLSILHKIDRAVLTEQSPEAIAQGALSGLRQLIPCRRASAIMFSSDTKTATILAVDTDGETTVQMGIPLTPEDIVNLKALPRGTIRVIRDMETFLSHRIEASPTLRKLQTEGIQSLLTVPLYAQGTLIGALNLAADRAGAFGEEEPRIAREVAGSLAVALQQARYQRLLERYRTIFALSPDYIYLTDITGRILDANPALLERTGLSLEHMQQMHFMDFFAGNAPEELLQHFTSLQDGHPVRGLEVGAKNVRGEIFTYEVNAIPLKENSEVTAILSVARDITARKRAEAQLKEEAEIAAALARVGQEMIASLNTPEILERLCRLTAEVLGCDCSHTVLWQPEDNTYVAAAGYGDTSEQWEALRVLKVPSEIVADLETQLTREGMIEIEVMTSQKSAFQSLLGQFGLTAELYVALRHGQQFIGAQSAGYRGRQGFSSRQKRIAQGIAQIASLALANARLLEELERSNRLKEDFVGAMSHELRTPMNILLGYNEMLRDGTYGSLTPEQVSVLERMDKNTLELLDLVNATLDLSRLQSRRVPLTQQDVWVSKLLAELEAETFQLNRKPALRLEWQVAAELPMLHTDIVKLRMILKNIIFNALKFTEEGTVTISAFSQDKGITFIVADTGPGIPPELLPAIFEPFRQGMNSPTHRQGGVGLGLYIVQQLLTLLGGTVSVESAVGRGSAFRVWIPQEI